MNAIEIERRADEWSKQRAAEMAKGAPEPIKSNEHYRTIVEGALFTGYMRGAKEAMADINDKSNRDD